MESHTGGEGSPCTCEIPNKIDQNIDVLVRLMNSSFMPDFSISLKKFPLPGPSGNNLAGEGGGMF